MTPSAPTRELFAEFDAALRLPDEPPSGQACPASTPQTPVTIYIETTEGRWQAHVPVDGCGLYLPLVEKVLSEIAIAL